MSKMIFREIVGKYIVSNYGIVVNATTGRVIHTYHNGTPYCLVNLCNNGKKKNYRVHRLVAMAFLDGYSESLTVDHLDVNPENNRLYNLEMVTLKENIRRANERRRRK